MQIEITPEYLQSQGLSLNFPERFWAKVHKTESCWIWTAHRKADGYGRMRKAPGEPTRLIYAHVASWILHIGPVPEGKCVLHNCPTGDEPACVNPTHLWLGTRRENNVDKATKGQSRIKVSDSDIQEIRRLYAETKTTHHALAERFGISQGMVSMIIAFKRRFIRPTVWRR